MLEYLKFDVDDWLIDWMRYVWLPSHVNKRKIVIFVILIASWLHVVNLYDLNFE